MFSSPSRTNSPSSCIQTQTHVWQQIISSHCQRGYPAGLQPPWFNIRCTCWDIRSQLQGELCHLSETVEKKGVSHNPFYKNESRLGGPKWNKVLITAVGHVHAGGEFVVFVEKKKWNSKIRIDWKLCRTCFGCRKQNCLLLQLNAKHKRQN